MASDQKPLKARDIPYVLAAGTALTAALVAACAAVSQAVFG